ncbi:MAG: DUF4367 domain-containing protein [Ruminiclostridium sp.]
MSEFSEQKEQAKEKMLEAMLEYAGACHVENIANEMNKENEVEKNVPFPNELDLSIKKLIKQYNRKKYFWNIWKRASRIVSRTAVVFLVFLLSFTILVSSVQAFRTRFFNFMIEIGKEFTSINLKEKEESNNSRFANDIPSDWKNVYIPQYVPEGYKISDTNSLVTQKTIHYTAVNKALIVFIQYSDKDTNIRVDTENAKVSWIVINDEESIVSEKGGMTTAVWHNSDCAFSLIGHISKEELIKMAESVEMKK